MQRILSVVCNTRVWEAIGSIVAISVVQGPMSQKGAGTFVICHFAEAADYLSSECLLRHRSSFSWHVITALVTSYVLKNQYCHWLF